MSQTSSDAGIKVAPHHGLLALGKTCATSIPLASYLPSDPRSSTRRRLALMLCELCAETAYRGQGTWSRHASFEAPAVRTQRSLRVCVGKHGWSRRRGVLVFRIQSKVLRRRHLFADQSRELVASGRARSPLHLSGRMDGLLRVVYRL
jgi:hypothetical protein